MKSSQQLTIFLLLIITGVYCQVKFAFELYRNGVTSPNILDKKNKDIFKEKWVRPEQLTVIGMKQQFTLGQKLRKHYVSRLYFLNPTFEADQFKIFSVDRSSFLLTAYSQMLGMFPGGGKKMLPPELKSALSKYDLYNAEAVYKDLKMSALPKATEVFPIVSFPPENNFFGLTDEKNCPGVKPIIKKNKEKEEVKKHLLKFSQKYFEALRQPLNLTQGYFEKYDNMQLFCNHYLAGYSDKRELNLLKPLNSTGKINFEELAEDCKQFGILDIYSVRLGDKYKDILKIASTNLIGQLISYMDEAIRADANNEPATKFVMYTGDLYDVGSFMAYLQLALGTPIFFPRFSSSLLIQLTKNNTANANSTKENDFHVNLFFNEKTLSTVKYAHFKQALLSHTTDNNTINDFCGFTDNSSLYFKLAALLLLCASIGLGVWISMLYKKMKKHDPMSLPDPEADADENLKKNLITAEEAK
jgi:hypothetical protein